MTKAKAAAKPLHSGPVGSRRVAKAHVAGIPAPTPKSTVNMLDAKTNLSKLVEAVESGAEKEIIIARNGKPAARLVPLNETKPKVRLGLAKGKFVVDDEAFDALDAEVARLFCGE